MLDSNAAAGADTIDFAPGLTGTIGLTSGELTITDAVTIDGPGAGALAVSGQGSSRIFNVDDGTAGTVPVAIDGLTLTGGYSYGFPGGGAIFNQENLTITGSVITGNTALGGGGIHNSNLGTLSLTNSTVSGNTAALLGGGIVNFGGTVVLTNSTVSDNAADNVGGGIHNNAGTLSLINSTVSGNTAYNGSGIYNSGTVTTANSTIASNSGASYPYGGGLVNYGTAHLNNSIVANNSGADLVFGNVVFGSHNLIGSTSGTAPNAMDDTLFFTNPNLGPLQDNGGPTLTHALLPGSPAIDAGSNALVPAGVTTDQRGTPFLRVVNGTVDIGAYEVAAAPNAPPVNTVPLGTVTGYQNVAIAITGIAVADPDAGSAPVQMTLSVLHGTLAIADDIAGGLAAGGISGNGSSTVVLTGTIAQINATLAAAGALFYTPTAGYTGTDTLTVATSDLGNTGSGGPMTDTDQVTIYVLSTLEQVSAPDRRGPAGHRRGHPEQRPGDVDDQQRPEEDHRHDGAVEDRQVHRRRAEAGAARQAEPGQRRPAAGGRRADPAGPGRLRPDPTPSPGDRAAAARKRGRRCSGVKPNRGT